MKEVGIIKNEDGKPVFRVRQDDNCELWLVNPEGGKITVDEMMEQIEMIRQMNTEEIPDADDVCDKGENYIYITIDHLAAELETIQQNLARSRA